MEIRGKAYCLFEQSGTFKNEFLKLGIPAEDYDIQNEYGQTDHIIDLFAEIENGYNGRPSLFDNITPDDLVMAFFPCIYFADAQTLMFKGCHIGQKGWSLTRKMDYNIKQARARQEFYERLMMLVRVIDNRGGRMVIENPFNTSGATFLQNNFLPPTFVDHNRMMRGDYYVKPTGYWFVGCEPTNGFTEQRDKKQRIIMDGERTKGTGVCSKERSEISPDYARNFICDFLIGREQLGTQLDLFK